MNIAEPRGARFPRYGYVAGGPRREWSRGAAVEHHERHAGILNLLAISGWVGIRVQGKERALVWGDLTPGGSSPTTCGTSAYVYNCLADRAWYSGRGAAGVHDPRAHVVRARRVDSYRAYTLTPGRVLHVPALHAGFG